MDKSEHQIIKEDLMRDYLASERTMMSVDRTFLSYVRTSLTLFIAGISLLKFFNTFFIHIVGWALIPAAIITFLLGVNRTLGMANNINQRATEDGYKIDFPQSIVRQHLYSLTIFVKNTLREIYRLFLPSAHHVPKNQT